MNRQPKQWNFAFLEDQNRQNNTGNDGENVEKSDGISAENTEIEMAEVDTTSVEKPENILPKSADISAPKVMKISNAPSTFTPGTTVDVPVQYKNRNWKIVRKVRGSETKLAKRGLKRSVGMKKWNRAQFKKMKVV